MPDAPPSPTATLPSDDPGADAEASSQTHVREQEILARIAGGDSAALVELYQAYGPAMHAYALKSLGDDRDAEEVLQDALIRIWNRSATFDPTMSKPFTWCYMIVRGLCLDRLRKRSAQKRSGVSVPLESVPEPEAPGDNVVQSIFLHEGVARVREALGHLHPLERRYIEMAVFGQITHTQIAGQVEEPLGTVKTRIRRGLVKLRRSLASQNHAR